MPFCTWIVIATSLRQLSSLYSRSWLSIPTSYHYHCHCHLGLIPSMPIYWSGALLPHVIVTTDQVTSFKPLVPHGSCSRCTKSSHTFTYSHWVTNFSLLLGLRIGSANEQPPMPREVIHEDHMATPLLVVVVVVFH